MRSSRRNGIVQRFGAALVSAGLAAGLFAGIAVTPVAAAGSVIVVNSLADTVADDGSCTFREAIGVVNSDSVPSGATTGECAAGVGDDTITFSVSGTIAVGSSLPGFSEGAGIDGDGAVTLDFGTGDSFLQFNGAGTASVSGLTLLGGTFAPSIQSLMSIAISDVHVSGKSWTGVGGGLYLTGAVSTVTDSTITGNTAGLGGGIYLGAGQLTLLRTTVSGNTADSGGGIFLSQATVTLDRSTVSGNTAQNGDGGGIASNGSGPLAIRAWNSTIAGNTATGAGGGILRDANLELVNATIANNTAGSGGGVSTVGVTWSLVMKNSALIGNTAAGLASDWANGIPGELGGAVHTQIGLGGKTLLDWFTTSLPANNGGPTQTMLPKKVTGNALIDGGDATTCSIAPISGKDQRGYGRVSPCDIGAADVDKTAPTVAGVKTTLRTGVTLSGTSSRGRVTWSAVDKGSGLATYTVQRRVGTGSWTTVGSGLTARSFDVTLVKGTTYAFRVRARDLAGNTGAPVAGPSFSAQLYQQTSGAFTFGSGWHTGTVSVYSGGSTRYSSTGGASGRFTATGRSYAWVSTYGPTRGKAKVYVNGTFVATVDLAGVTTYRAQAWSAVYSTSTSRTIRIVISGSGKRVDVDAFAVLR